MIQSIIKVVRGIVKLRGGTDGTVIGNSSDSLKTYITNSLTASPGHGSAISYSSVANAFVPALLATDVFVIKGSATKTVKVTLVGITCTTTAGSGVSVNLSLIKRSTANTGGTTVTNASAPHDSTDTAATAVVTHYTANPTALGTAVGTMRALRQTFSTNGTVNNITEFTFSGRPSKAIVLRGVNESLAVNLGITTVTGPVATIYIEFTEE